MELVPGLTGQAELVVSANQTALDVGSGDLTVLSTPHMLALCEAATVSAVTDFLDSDSTTVGVEVHLEHRSPSRIGDEVVAHATLESIHGHRLRFRVEALSVGRLAASGTVERVVVNRQAFLDRNDI